MKILCPTWHNKAFSQKSIEEGLDIHGVRFDVFALDDGGNAIEIEMQVLDTGSIPKRMRYYGSINDMQMLEKGSHTSGSRIPMSLS